MFYDVKVDEGWTDHTLGPLSLLLKKSPVYVALVEGFVLSLRSSIDNLEQRVVEQFSKMIV